MKKFTLLFAFVMSLLLSFGCCATLNNINSPPLNLVDHLKNSTSTLVVKADNGAYMPYCGAVWVNKTDMVTAKHCVDMDDDNKADVGSTVKFQIYKEFENTYPFSSNKKVYVAKIIAGGAENEDVALLRSVDDVEHGVATVAAYNPRGGQVAHHIGHPRALQWSYIKCYISEERNFGVKKPREHYLNIVGFVWMGSSGGGAYDDQGNLMGIASGILPAPGQSLFVHVDVIESVLDKNKIKYHTLN